MMIQSGRFPAVNSLRERNIIDLDKLPVAFCKDPVTDATRGKYRGDIIKSASQVGAHLVDVVPLLLGHRGPNVVRGHLRFVEKPLENKQGR